MKIRHSHVVLDACCVLNLSASGQLIAILQSLSVPAVVTAVVSTTELKTLQRLEADHNEGASGLASESATQFHRAIAQGVLTVVDFASAVEEETFINYAFALGDDGESATGAIAVHRDWAIATDDKRAIAFFRKEAPTIQVLSTLEIVRHWSEVSALSNAALRTVLTAIRVQGRYLPDRNHPLLTWWQDSMG